MLMPSLPPLLKPWMMRPRAGQRNSGLASTAGAVSGFGGRLAVGWRSTPALSVACWIFATGAAAILAALAGAGSAAFCAGVATCAVLPGLPFTASTLTGVGCTLVILPGAPLTMTSLGCGAAVLASAGFPWSVAACSLPFRDGVAALAL